MLGDRPPLEFVFDNSPPEGHPGVLGAILTADTAGLGGASTRKRVLLRTLVRYFGERAGEPIAYVEKDWALDHWSTGCMSPLAPGVLTRTGPALAAAGYLALCRRRARQTE